MGGLENSLFGYMSKWQDRTVKLLEWHFWAFLDCTVRKFSVWINERTGKALKFYIGWIFFR